MATNWEVKYHKMNKMRSFAWAKFYEAENLRLTSDTRTVERVQTITKYSDTPLPPHIINEFLTMAEELKKTWECPVCMEMIKPDNLDITNCGHYFCKPCLVEFKSRNRADCKCPMCRRKINVGSD